MPPEEFLAELLALLGKRHRFCLADRILDHALRVQPVQSIPVVSFPSTSFVMEREKKKREHHLIDLVFIVVHQDMVLDCRRVCNGAPIAARGLRASGLETGSDVPLITGEDSLK